VRVNDPDVVHEVRAAFYAYEGDLLANDLAALDAWFWDGDGVVRFAFGDVQIGAEQVAAARRAVARQTGPRIIEALHVTALGSDVAVVFAAFRLEEDDRLVHQSQTWARLDGRWRVVAAHVSNA
jgi:hypothetical protein